MKSWAILPIFVLFGLFLIAPVTKTYAQSESHLSSELLAQNDTLRDFQEKLIHENEVMQHDMDELSQTNKKFKIFSIIIVFFTLIFISLILYNSVKSKSVSKEIIDKNRALVEAQQSQLDQRNFELEQGLLYARRIQEAVLPLEDDIKNDFEDAFVLFEPKNVVSGDFYWFYKLGGLKILSVLDCTGHGIAGGYMALLGNEILNKIVEDPSVSNCGHALTHMNLQLVQSFSKINDSNQLIDGMEVALCAINEEKQVIEYAGAYRDLYLIRDGELQIIGGDSKQIGVDKGLRKQFNQKELPIQKGDQIYLFTDGYVNQFGGVEGKKFKYKGLQKLLLEICKEPMEKQRDLLLSAHIEWKGTTEQIDDICIVGIKI